MIDEGSALDHSFTNYVSNNDATCTEDGTKTAKCDRCDETHTVTDEGSVLGHDYDVVVTPPTCTEKGYTTYTCHCGDSYIDDYVKENGHTHKFYDFNKNGHWSICGVCGESFDTEAHDLVNNQCVCGLVNVQVNIYGESDEGFDEAKQPEVEVYQQVVTVQHENVCVVIVKNENGEYEKLEATKNEDGSYSFEAPEYVTEVIVAVKGDYDGDGEVTQNDVSAMHSDLLNSNEYSDVDVVVYDVNGDGFINAADLARLYAILTGNATLVW